MSDKKAGQKVVLRDNVVFTRFETDGDGVLLNLTTKNYYTLNETAAFIWARLETGLDAESITADLASEYEISTTNARDSVWELTSELEKEGLVQIL